MYTNEAAQVNDRLSRLVEQLRAQGISVEEDPLHPAVSEAAACGDAVAAAYEQLAYTARGRQQIAERFGVAAALTIESALELVRGAREHHEAGGGETTDNASQGERAVRVRSGGRQRAE